ncbi:ATP-dependent DNA helicase PIF1-like [Aphis craccivora]|uniref:ATP-dependent DNA helicase PIF1-like n=1 Tax=Aphis craccivora TaxID=307492 RepID=A0A6G0YZP7_APHCR|nr:ATP-dependent DNA helicase PIF1-like [Aphis craccivora]
MVVQCELVVAGQLFLVLFFYGELYIMNNFNQKGTKIVKALVINGCARGDIVIIPRITLIQTDYLFEFKITQFSLKVCFAMTISKSKEQSLIMAEIGLKEECFLHG